jgi:hypothetical protein
MTNLTDEALRVVITLLPGFLSVKIKDFFTTAGARGPFDQLMEVVAFSVANYLFAGAGYVLLSWCLSLFAADVHSLAPAVEPPGSLMDLTLPAYLYVLATSSVVLGVLTGVVVGHDFHYRSARRLRLTNRTGRLEVWQDAFADIQGNWVVVHLRGGRRLIGWPLYYSERGDSPSVFLKDAAWVDDRGEETVITGEGILVTGLGSIEAVEFRGQGLAKGAIP